MSEPVIVPGTPRWIKDIKLEINKDNINANPLARLVDDFSATLYNAGQNALQINQNKNAIINNVQNYINRFQNEDSEIDLIIKQDLDPDVTITGNILSDPSQLFINPVDVTKKILVGDQIIITYFNSVSEKTEAYNVSAVISDTQIRFNGNLTGASSVRYVIKRINKSINSMKDDLVNSISTFSEDLSNTGGKFIISHPFYGGLTTARSQIVNQLTSSSENFPNYSESVHTTSFTVVINMGEDLINVVKFMTVLYFLFYGKEGTLTDQLKEMFESPWASPFYGLMQNELIEVKQDAENIGTSFSDPYNDIFNVGGALFETLKDDPLNQIKSIWDNSIAKEIPFNFLDPTNTDTALGSMLNSLSKGKPLENFFDEANPFTEMVKRATEINIPSPSNIFANITQAKKPYDSWFNLLTLGDIFPGVKDVTQFGIKAIDEVSGTFNFVADGVKNGLEFVKQGSDLIVASASDIIDATTNLTDRFKAELDLFSMNVFYTPPMEGGTEQLRFVYEQWMKEGIAEAPDLQDESLSITFTVVFGGPSEVVKSGLTTVGKLFNMEFVEA